MANQELFERDACRTANHPAQVAARKAEGVRKLLNGDVCGALLLDQPVHGGGDLLLALNEKGSNLLVRNFREPAECLTGNERRRRMQNSA